MMIIGLSIKFAWDFATNEALRNQLSEVCSMSLHPRRKADDLCKRGEQGAALSATSPKRGKGEQRHAVLIRVWLLLLCSPLLACASAFSTQPRHIRHASFAQRQGRGNVPATFLSLCSALSWSQSDPRPRSRPALLRICSPAAVVHTRRAAHLSRSGASDEGRQPLSADHAEAWDDLTLRVQSSAKNLKS